MRTLKRSLLALTSGMVFGINFNGLGCLGEFLTNEFEVLFALDSLDTAPLLLDSLVFDWFGEFVLAALN
jgi:hypothetical protein